MFPQREKTINKVEEEVSTYLNGAEVGQGGAGRQKREEREPCDLNCWTVLKENEKKLLSPNVC